MIRINDLHLPPDYTEEQLRKTVARCLHIAPREIKEISLFRRAVDARKKEAVCFCLSVDVNVSCEEAPLLRRPHVSQSTVPVYTPVIPNGEPQHRPVVVGGGPAGLFAALILARAGLRPILVERGRDVDTRTADVERFRATGVLDTASNVQFGEGGAGTFSDGKLNTGIKDPRCRLVLEEFVAAGAPQEILWQAKPHVGTDKLKETVKGLRRAIVANGGEVRFGCLVTDVVLRGNTLSALRLLCNGEEEEIPCSHAIFAIGHSARDTVTMLYERGIPMEQKPFAVGVRIEHPRTWIDTAQYGSFAGHPALGAADYKLSCHLPNGRGVYTFCMCPGGEVIAAASEAGGVAVNGMSEFARNSTLSNSALLVGVNPSDFTSDHALAGIALQRDMEQAAFRLGGGDYRAPAQTVGDFLTDTPSRGFSAVIPSYRPGVTPADLRECLPSYVAHSLKDALPLLGRKLNGFDSPAAVLTGVESRSSSPVRISRDASGQSAVRGIFPCGEGAGYAGGITSAAADGIRCAEWLIRSL